MQNQKKLEDIIKDLDSYLSEEEKQWLEEYLEAGEEGREKVSGMLCRKHRFPGIISVYDYI